MMALRARPILKAFWLAADGPGEDVVGDAPGRPRRRPAADQQRSAASVPPRLVGDAAERDAGLAHVPPSSFSAAATDTRAKA